MYVYVYGRTYLCIGIDVDEVYKYIHIHAAAHKHVCLSIGVWGLRSYHGPLATPGGVRPAVSLHPGRFPSLVEERPQSLKQMW